jgi:hypothetical protein
VIGEAPLAMDAGWVERNETHRIMRRTGWVSLRSYELIRTQFTENIMTTQRFLVVLTLLNLALLVFLLTQTRLSIGAQGVRLRTNADHSVLRGRALEIVDDEGRIRAAINLHPADPVTSYPETVVLRLIDPNGRPSVKLATSERGGGLALVSEAQGNYMQLSGREIAVTKDGQRHAIP